MAEESLLQRQLKSLLSLKNNPAIQGIGEQFSYDNIFPQGIMGALVGPGSLNTSDDYEGNAVSDYLNNLNLKTENFMSSDSDTQGEQILKNILEKFRGVGETTLDVLELPGRKLEEGIEFLQSPSDLRLEEAAKENEIENQRRLSIEGLEPPIGGYQELLDNADELSDLGFIDVTQFDVEKQEKEQAAAKVADKLNLQGPNFVPIAKDKPEPEIDTGTNIVENGYLAAMKDLLSGAEKEPTTSNESKSEAIERYNKEFAEATGLDVSGKPDKSRFLMALGLNLMQNKAGKKFNISKMIDAGAEATEEAMPFLDKALTNAKAAKMASGKYALDQINAGRSSASAIAAAELAFQRERLLKIYDTEAGIEKEKIKAGAKVGEIKNVKVDKVINGLEVQRGRSSTGPVFAFPMDALRDSSGALRSVNGALATVDQMTELLTQINSEDSPTFQLIADSVNTALVGAGFKDANVVFDESKVGKRQQVRLLQDSIITQFKRMLTQETGNGISKSDVENVRVMLGNIDLLGNPEESILRLKEIKTLFAGKRNAIRGVLDELQDPDNYPTKSEYDKNMELYPSLIQGSMQYSVSNNGSSSVIDVKDQ